MNKKHISEIARILGKRAGKKTKRVYGRAHFVFMGQESARRRKERAQALKSYLSPTP